MKKIYSINYNLFYKLGLFFLLIFLPQTILSQLQFSYTILTNEQIINIGSSKTFYVPVTGIPSNAVITNIEAKFDYIAYGVVQNYVSCRFNKDTDPGTSGGISLVSQGNLPAGNPSSYGYNSFSNWNGNTSINTNYYFRFSLASGSPYTCTISKIYVRVSYSTALSPPTLVSPTNGGMLSGPPYQFTWQSVSTASAYQLKIADNVSFTNIIVNDQNISGSATSFQTNASLSNGQTYYWQMRTLNSSGTTWGSWGQYQSFTLPQAALSPPTLVSPTNGGMLSGPPYQFTWQSVSTASAYQLKIAENTSFTNTIVNDQNISGSATSFQTSASLSNGQTYYWQMRTLNSSGTTWGSWGQYQSFTLPLAALSPPTLVSPTNGGMLSGPPYQFTWQSVSTASAYQLKIADNVSFTNIIVNDQNISGSATSFQTNTSLSNGQTYYWQMRTLNSSGTTWGSWGQYQSFMLTQDQYCKPVDNFPNSGGFIGFGTGPYQDGTYHNGADFSASVGSSVYAIRDGYVIRSGEHNGFGSLNPSTTGGVIIIRHSDNDGNYFFAVYGHLNRSLSDNYTGQPGNFVTQGQKIGTICAFTNGGVSMPHIHFGIFVGSIFPNSGWGYSSDLTDWRNPYLWLNTNCGSMISSTTAVYDIIDNNRAIKVYPNPVSESFHINGFDSKVSLKLIDISGKEILTKQVTGNETISVSNLPKGVYIVKIVTTGGIVERKLVKK